MYGIFTYIWVIFSANVGKYSIHGAYGILYIYVGGTFGVYFVRSVRTIICTIYIRFIYRHVHDSALGMY